jgi:DNA-binding GntR family transcriptional regulator
MSETQAERVAARLRDDIVDGVRAPGDRLVERDLAEQLGVSRVPVREAIRDLVAEGLVIARPRSWAVVREFSEHDVADLEEVRTALELMTFRLAAERRTDRQAAALRALADAGLTAADTGDAARARRISADFHALAVEIAANRLLAEIEHQLRGRLRWLYGQHDDLMAVAYEHAGLADAVAAQDVTALSGLVPAHLATGHRLVRDRISLRPTPGEPIGTPWLTTTS